MSLSKYLSNICSCDYSTLELESIQDSHVVFVEDNFKKKIIFCPLPIAILKYTKLQSYKLQPPPMKTEENNYFCTRFTAVKISKNSEITQTQ